MEPVRDLRAADRYQRPEDQRCQKAHLRTLLLRTASARYARFALGAPCAKFYGFFTRSVKVRA